MVARQHWGQSGEDKLASFFCSFKTCIVLPCSRGEQIIGHGAIIPGQSVSLYTAIPRQSALLYHSASKRTIAEPPPHTHPHPRRVLPRSRQSSVSSSTLIVQSKQKCAYTAEMNLNEVNRNEKETKTKLSPCVLHALRPSYYPCGCVSPPSPTGVFCSFHSTNGNKILKNECVSQNRYRLHRRQKRIEQKCVRVSGASQAVHYLQCATPKTKRNIKICVHIRCKPALLAYAPHANHTNFHASHPCKPPTMLSVSLLPPPLPPPSPLLRPSRP